MALANWNSITQYLPGDQVYYAPDIYYALLPNLDVLPPTLAPYWFLRTPAPFAPSYASFFSTALQPLATGAETLVSYTNTSVSTPDIVLVSPSRIQFNTTGVYTFLYSLQTDKQPGGGTSADVEVYLKINGVALPNSSSRTNITNAVEQLLTCDYQLSLTAGQVVEVGAYTTGTNVRFPFFAPIGTAPATPSVIVNLQRIA